MKVGDLIRFTQTSGTFAPIHGKVAMIVSIEQRSGEFCDYIDVCIALNGASIYLGMSQVKRMAEVLSESR